MSNPHSTLRRALLAGAILLAAAGCARVDNTEPKAVVFFNLFSADLDTPALGTIAEFAKDANQLPRRPVLVEGFADKIGSSQANQLLSQLRAQVVADALVTKGVDRARITMRPRGPTTIDPGIESRRVELELGR